MAESRKKFSLSLVFRLSRTSSSSQTEQGKKAIYMYKYSPNLHQMPIHRSKIPSFWKGLPIQGSKKEVSKICSPLKKYGRKAEFITRLGLVWVLLLSELKRYKEKSLSELKLYKEKITIQ